MIDFLFGQGKPSVVKGLRSLAQLLTFGTVEVLAALRLDGALSICLWLIAAWNAFLMVMFFVGLMTLATSALNATPGDAA
ncbi:MAG: hypothetical protein JWO46_2447 [Nocardioidaceae bacterium]|nr:hypothetical protein [Nocardioidaceae bacterium]